jgi:hypothetical protein
VPELAKTQEHNKADLDIRPQNRLDNGDGVRRWWRTEITSEGKEWAE